MPCFDRLSMTLLNNVVILSVSEGSRFIYFPAPDVVRVANRH